MIKKTLIITRRPSTLLRLFKEVPELPKLINVANIPHEGKGFMIRRDCWIDDEQKDALNQLDGLGVDIYFQQFPGDGLVDIHWKNVKDQY